MEQIIQAKMLIGADGGHSAVRDAANIGVQGWQYSQQALGIQIKTPEVNRILLGNNSLLKGLWHFYLYMMVLHPCLVSQRSRYTTFEKFI